MRALAKRAVARRRAAAFFLAWRGGPVVREARAQTAQIMTPRQTASRLRLVNPCLVCGRTPSDAHHLCFAEPRELGRKVSDEFTASLCWMASSPSFMFDATREPGGRPSRSIRRRLHKRCGMRADSAIESLSECDVRTRP